jgi:small subunit ribosomal protein S4
MGRYTGPTDKLSRREGVNLMLKGARSESGKLERRLNSPPGMHPWRRGRTSEFGQRLREKQKLKRYYGVREKQFQRYYRMAERTRGNTAAALLTILERRLDNVIYKLGFAESRPAARQTVSHGHIYVNGRRCNIASYLVNVGDKISVKPSEKSKGLIRRRLEELGDPHLQNWLGLDMPKLEAEITAMPTSEDVMLPVEIQLVIEFCSR